MNRIHETVTKYSTKNEKKKTKNMKVDDFVPFIVIHCRRARTEAHLKAKAEFIANLVSTDGRCVTSKDIKM